MRRWLAVVALGLVGLAAAEIAVLVLVAGWIGVGWTVLLLLGTTLLGGWLLRREGAQAWRRFRAAAETGRPAGGEVSRGLVGLLSALLLVVPGFLTDLVGLVLLAPPARAAAVRLATRSAERRLPPAAAGDLFGPRRVRAQRGTPDPASQPASQPPSSVIDGEVID